MRKATTVTLAVPIWLTLLAHAFAQGNLPRAGTDRMDSIAELGLQLGCDRTQPVLDFGLVGPMAVRRSNPLSAPGGNGNIMKIETEMLQLDLKGASGIQNSLFDLHVGLNGDMPTRGLITVGLDNNPFPAESFFDVFVEVDLTVNGQPSGVHINRVPVRMEAMIHSIPPREDAYTPVSSQPVPLFLKGGPPDARPTACLVHAQHVPADPSHVKIKRELIKIERKLDLLLRAHTIPIP